MQNLRGQVEVRNFSQSGQSASLLLYFLREKQELREAIQKAEVITIYTGWNDLFEPRDRYCNEILGGEDNLDCI